MTIISIDHLADHPAMLAALADAFRAESPAYFADRSTTSIVETLLEPTLQRDALPVTLVAHDGGRLIGTVALRAAPLFQRLDWQVVETLVYYDEPITILRRDIASGSDGPQPQLLPLPRR